MTYSTINVALPIPNIFVLDLKEPGKIFWQFKPKQNAVASALAYCDVIHRELTYTPAGDGYPATIFLNQLDD